MHSLPYYQHFLGGTLRTLPDRFRNSVRFTIMLSVVGIVAVISPPVITEAGGASGGWNSTNSVRLMADVNGDGREDIVGFGDAGVWRGAPFGSILDARLMHR